MMLKRMLRIQFLWEAQYMTPCHMTGRAIMSRIGPPATVEQERTYFWSRRGRLRPPVPAWLYARGGDIYADIDCSVLCSL